MLKKTKIYLLNFKFIRKIFLNGRKHGIEKLKLLISFEIIKKDFLFDRIKIAFFLVSNLLKEISKLYKRKY